MSAPVRVLGDAIESASGPMAVSVAIGDRLVTEAIWSKDRCNWVGAVSVDARNGNGAGPGLTYRALGPDLYSGSSGVALFLAQLSAATGQDLYRPTARAAMRHALSRRDDVSAATRRGFYGGWAGMAATALRTGLLLDSDELVAAGTALLRDVGRLTEAAGRPDLTPAGQQEFDLVAGMAGAIPALALGHRFTGDDGMAEAAAAAGEWLVRTARQTPAGWSWRAPGLRHQRDLTGFSHGAAGVAVALIEAFRLTGEHVFATGARNAMRYEDRWLDAGQGNWPDFRENPADRHARTFLTMWCHGAPGIALSRLHAYEQLGDLRWWHDARIALDTTERVTRQLADGGGIDFSLCHGLAGNAEPFIEASRVLGPDAVAADIPWLVADHGLERYVGTGVAWPCGTHSEQTPNLMLGLAGIGYFYLRLAEPRIPSVLLPVRWDS
jgi:lantibiotic modifying enzyme